MKPERDPIAAGPCERVGVAMATCNGERFLASQLESIAAQTRRPDVLAISDDASEDGTIAIIEDFAARAPFEVRLRRNRERLGTTGNFQEAIRLCEGDVIFLADQDDFWLPEKVETLVAVLDARPDAGAVFSDGAVVDAQDRPLGYGLWEAQGFTPAEQRTVREGRAHEVFLRHVVAAGTTMAFRGRYKTFVLPFPELRSAHDAWTAFLISCVANVAIEPRELIRYRLHGENQFGLRRFGLREQLVQAREQLRWGAFGYAVRFFDQSLIRLQAQHAPGLVTPPEVIEEIERKIEHTAGREALSEWWGARLPAILYEGLRGRYRRYSYGWKSMAQDLFLR